MVAGTSPVKIPVKAPARVPFIVWGSVITGIDVTELQQIPRVVTDAPPSEVIFPPLFATVLSVPWTMGPAVVMTVGKAGVTVFPYTVPVAFVA